MPILDTSVVLEAGDEGNGEDDAGGDGDVYTDDDVFKRRGVRPTLGGSEGTAGPAGAITDGCLGVLVDKEEGGSVSSHCKSGELDSVSLR